MSSAPIHSLASIVGASGSGKSTFCQYVEEMGIPVISCDAVNAELLKNEEVLDEIAALLDEEKVDKKIIANTIYSSPEKKARLEEYLHGQIWKRILDFIDENSMKEMVIVEVPLLFETDWYKRFDVNVLIDTDKNKAAEALKLSRNMSYEQYQNILKNQMPDEAKKDKADIVIINDKDLTALAKKAEKMVYSISKLQEYKQNGIKGEGQIQSNGI